MTRRFKGGTALFLLASAVGLAAAVYGYATPLTGITGSLGALVVICSSAALVLAGVLLLVLRSRGLRVTFEVLALLGIVGTAAAAWFLHSWILVGAMAVALVALVVAMTAPAPRRLRGTEAPA